MKYAYICALSSINVNLRQSATTSSPVVGTLSRLGLFCESLGERYIDGYMWYEFKSLDNYLRNKNFWVRGDVFHQAILNGTNHEVKPLTYHSQNDANSNVSPNDCGPASACIMLSHANHNITVNGFMYDAGINHTGFTTFMENTKGLRVQGYDSEVMQSFTLSKILEQIVNNKPVFSLVYYHNLIHGNRYGHFLVIAGYKIENNELLILTYDPNTNVRYFSDEMMTNALGYVGGAGNLPYQSLLVNYPEVIIEDEKETIIEQYVLNNTLYIITDKNTYIQKLTLE
jgi:hypothetical protein